MKNLYLILLLLVSSVTFAQKQWNTMETPCGTSVMPDFLEKSLDEYVTEYYKTGGKHLKSVTVKDMPLTLHIISNDNGTQAIATRTMIGRICELNEIFNEYDMNLWVKNINHHRNSLWNERSTTAPYFERDQMINLTKDPNSVNSYVASNTPGLCGVYMGTSVATRGDANGFPDVTFLANGCIANDVEVWAHELGHYFSLPHTFSPLDRGAGLTSSTDGFCYDKFGRGLDWFEYYTRDSATRNCETAGDRFCDTEADYEFRVGGSNWPNCKSCEFEDYLGERFNSTGKSYMSYAPHYCQSEFSPMQVGAMHYNVERSRKYLTRQANPMSVGDIVEKPTAITPAMGEVVDYNRVYFEWSAVENADFYLLEVSKSSSFAGSSVVQEKVVKGATNIWLEDIPNNRTLYWRVSPFSGNLKCNTIDDYISDYHEFTTSQTSSTLSVNANVNSFNVYPNPASDNEVTVAINSNVTENTNLEVRNISGALVYSERVLLNKGQNTFKIPVNQMSNGVYVVTFNLNNTVNRQRLVINK